MDIKQENSTVIITGSLDSATAPALQKYLDEKFPTPGELTLNLHGATLITSAGLRVFVSAHKKHTLTLLIEKTNPAFKPISMVGLDAVITIRS